MELSKITKKKEVENKLYLIVYRWYKDSDDYKSYIKSCWDSIPSGSIRNEYRTFENWFKGCIFDGFNIEGVKEYMGHLIHLIGEADFIKYSGVYDYISTLDVEEDGVEEVQIYYCKDENYPNAFFAVK